MPGTQGYGAYGPQQVLTWPYSTARRRPWGAAAAARRGIRDRHLRHRPGRRGGGAAWRPRAGYRRRHRPCSDGLVIDPASHHVTHVLLQEGHLWGRKEVAIPISAVTSTDDGIWLSLTKHQVGARCRRWTPSGPAASAAVTGCASGWMGQPLAPQTGQAPMPWPASTRSATAIWSAAEAWLRRKARRRAPAAALYGGSRNCGAGGQLCPAMVGDRRR